MKREQILATVCSVLCLLVKEVQSHGRLRMPPARNVIWRDVEDAPKMYDDVALNCGGFQTQHGRNQGRCGVCGDPYDAKVQEFQPPSGRYAKGIIGQCYTKGTQIIEAKVEITANHLGHVEFRLCPNNDVNKPVTQECLDKNRLQISDKSGVLQGNTFNITQASPVTMEMLVQLPEGLTCSHCVLQWTYVTGNSWGCEGKDVEKKCGLGQGPQETFVNCADISVLENCRDNAKLQTRKQAVAGPSLTKHEDVTDAKGSTHFETNDRSRSRGNFQSCRGINAWTNNDNIDRWCDVHCRVGFCPQFMCQCD